MKNPLPPVERFGVSEADIKKLKLGQYVEVTICGYVKDLSAPLGEYGCCDLGLKVDTREVRLVESSQAEGFRDLSEDIDEEPNLVTEYKK